MLTSEQLAAIRERREQLRTGSLADMRYNELFTVCKEAGLDIDALLAEVERVKEQLTKAKTDTEAINEAIQCALADELTKDSLESLVRKLDEHTVIMLITDFRGLDT